MGREGRIKGIFLNLMWCPYLTPYRHTDSVSYTPPTGRDAVSPSRKEKRREKKSRNKNLSKVLKLSRMLRELERKERMRKRLSHIHVIIVVWVGLGVHIQKYGVL